MPLALKPNLYDLIINQERLSESFAIYFVFEILKGVDLMHKQEITHMDLKP